MRENLPPGASDAASPDLPPEERKAFAHARAMTDERAEWELFGTDWNETYGQKLAEHDRLIKDGMQPTPKAGAAAPVAPRPATQEDTQP